MSKQYGQVATGTIADGDPDIIDLKTLLGRNCKKLAIENLGAGDMSVKPQGSTYAMKIAADKAFTWEFEVPIKNVTLLKTAGVSLTWQLFAD